VREGTAWACVKKRLGGPAGAFAGAAGAAGTAGDGRRSGEGAVKDSPWMVQEIVVGLDGSRMAEAVIEPAAALARILQWPMTLVQVVLPLAVAADPPLPFPVGYDEQITEVRRREALDYLEDVAEGLRGEGIAAAATAVVGEPARTLLDLGRRSGVSSWRLGPAAAGGSGVSCSAASPTSWSGVPRCRSSSSQRPADRTENAFQTGTVRG
jgi:hypothetical protein